MGKKCEKESVCVWERKRRGYSLERCSAGNLLHPSLQSYCAKGKQFITGWGCTRVAYGLRGEGHNFLDSTFYTEKYTDLASRGRCTCTRAVLLACSVVANLLKRDGKIRSG